MQKFGFDAEEPHRHGAGQAGNGWFSLLLCADDAVRGWVIAIGLRWVFPNRPVRKKQKPRTRRGRQMITSL